MGIKIYNVYCTQSFAHRRCHNESVGRVSVSVDHVVLSARVRSQCHIPFVSQIVASLPDILFANFCCRQGSADLKFKDLTNIRGGQSKQEGAKSILEEVISTI